MIRSFNTLYSQARIDALDALDNIREMSEAEDLKSKLLFSVVVVRFSTSFRFFCTEILSSSLFVMLKITLERFELKSNKFCN